MTATTSDLVREGLLELGDDCHVSPWAIFDAADVLGDSRPIVLDAGVRVGHGAVIYGGTRIGAAAVIEDHAVVGKPEHGYAVGFEYPGAGKPTKVGSGAVIRGGAIVYAGCEIGKHTMIGHHTTIRSDVVVGERSQLAHRLSVERACRIGSNVRCSPGSHITSDVVMEDWVFIGAGVVTVNDKGMVWRDPEREPELLPPHFAYACKVGSGSSIAGGVRIGRDALIGTGSVVLRDVPAYAVAYGVPATVKGRVSNSPL